MGNILHYEENRDAHNTENIALAPISSQEINSYMATRTTFKYRLLFHILYHDLDRNKLRKLKFRDTSSTMQSFFLFLKKKVLTFTHTLTQVPRHELQPGIDP